MIRASVYARIADALRGSDATARFRHWVKKSEFFLIERSLPATGSVGACLAVPSMKTTAITSSNGAQQESSNAPNAQQSSNTTPPRSAGARSREYKTVARLEDFVFIIGHYHNDLKGHSGIRRTYAMVSA